MKRGNLNHIINTAFNEPLLLEPGYAGHFFAALSDRCGFQSLSDPAKGLTLKSEELAEYASLYGTERPSAPSKSYPVVNGIAVIDVSGTLVNKLGSMRPYSGMTGYDGITGRIAQAIKDSSVTGILIDIDSPGGMVAGAFDCADVISRMGKVKPIWTLASDMACSAGQLIAAAGSRRLVTQTSITGSIGVIMAHINREKAAEMEGIEVTLIYSGKHKADLNGFQKIPDAVKENMQKRMDATRAMFAEKVSQYSGLKTEKILATEAAIFNPEQAKEIGLAHEIVNSNDAVNVMAEFISQQVNKTRGVFMKADGSDENQASNNSGNETKNAENTSANESSNLMADAIKAENTRIMGILNCEEAKGRGALANVLAQDSTCSVEKAQQILKAAALEPHARSGTALDNFMKDSPNSASSSNGDSEGKMNILDIPC